MDMREMWILIPVLAILCGIVGTVASAYTTRLMVKNGYPVEGDEGNVLRPGSDAETRERLRMLDTDSAKLRAEVASLKDRVAVLERIATDGARRLSDEIDALRH